MLKPEQFVLYTDHVVRAYGAIIGESSSGHGIGGGTADIADDWGFSLHARNFLGDVIATHDFDSFEVLGSAVNGAVKMAASTNMYGSVIQGILKQMDALCRKAGIPGVLDTGSYATYYNTGAGGPYNALVSQDYVDLYSKFMSKRKFSSSNIYPPAMPLTKFDGSPVDGLDLNKYAGFSAVSVALVNPRFNDSGSRVLMVSGTARTKNGQIEDDHSWSCNLANGTDTFMLVPSQEGDLMISIERIRTPAILADGSGPLVIMGLAPEGRP